MPKAIFILIAILVACCVVGAYFYIRKHMLGTFKFDNSGETYRCRMEFDSLDEIEKLKFAIVMIKEENLGLPGERPQR